MNRSLIISSTKNDLSDLILRHCPGAAMYAPNAEDISFECFDAACILGGQETEPLILPARTRCALETMRQAGKPIFAEFVLSFSQIYGDHPIRSTHHRMLVSDATFCMLTPGDLLDDHDNDRIPYYFLPASTRVVLRQFDYLCGHDHVNMSEEEMSRGAFGMGWIDATTLICAFRLCNFRRARLGKLINMKECGQRIRRIWNTVPMMWTI